MSGSAAASDNPAGKVPASLHASVVAVGEAGVLIRGPSGAGKSSLALSLLDLAAQAGRFARLVGDDRIDVIHRARRLIARGHPLIQGMIEARGEGIIRLPHEPAVVLRLVVDLLPGEELARFPDSEDTLVEVCGAKLPRLALRAEGSSYDCAQRVMAHLRHVGTI